jgi:acetyl esterase
VLSAGCDPLRDEGRQCADPLSAAGNRVQCVCFERQFHGVITRGCVVADAHITSNPWGALLQRAFNPLAGAARP